MTHRPGIDREALGNNAGGFSFWPPDDWPLLGASEAKRASTEIWVLGLFLSLVAGFEIRSGRV
jgi:hypothetical protein